MFALIIKILVLLLVAGIVVSIHELGHLLAAKSCGVRVQKFSIFLSPLFYIIVWRPGRYLRFFVNKKNHNKLVDETMDYDLEHFEDIKPRSWKDTEYTLGWMPIGGYCKFDTQYSRTDVDSSKVIVPYWDIRCINVWKHLFIILSGVIANAILAVCLLAIYTVKEKEDTSNALIYSQYAQSVGFQNDDEILLADTFHITNPLVDMNSILTASSVTVLRGEDTVTINIPPYFRDSIYHEAINKQSYPFVYYNFHPLLSEAESIVEEPEEDVSEFMGLLSYLDYFPDDWDWLFLVLLTYGISIGVIIFNLLPIPGLDGAQAFFCILDIVFRGKINKNVLRWLGWINYIGWIIVFLWIIYLNVRDIFKLF